MWGEVEGVVGLNGDVRLNSDESGSVEVEMYRGTGCQRPQRGIS